MNVIARSSAGPRLPNSMGTGYPFNWCADGAKHPVPTGKTEPAHRARRVRDRAEPGAAAVSNRQKQ